MPWIPVASSASSASASASTWSSASSGGGWGEWRGGRARGGKGGQLRRNGQREVDMTQTADVIHFGTASSSASTAASPCKNGPCAEAVEEHESAKVKQRRDFFVPAAPGVAWADIQSEPESSEIEVDAPSGNDANSAPPSPEGGPSTMGADKLVEELDADEPASVMAAELDPTAAWWSSEVAALAQRLRFLASVAASGIVPCVPVRVFVPDVSASACQGSDELVRREQDMPTHALVAPEAFESLEVGEAREAREAEVAELERSTDMFVAEKMEVLALEQEASALAARAVACEAEAKAAVIKEAEALAEANAVEAEAAAAELAATSVGDPSAAVRAEALTEERAADVAEAKLAHLRAEHASAQLPQRLEQKALQKREEERVESLESICAQLSRAREDLEAELTALLTSATAARADSLEARVATLELECRELQQHAAAAAPEADSKASGAKVKTKSVAKELAEAKELNHRVIGELRQARARRTEAEHKVAKLKDEILAWQSLSQRQTAERSDLDTHLTVMSRRTEEAKREVAMRHEEMAELQAQASQAETVAVRCREQQSAVDAKARDCVLARRKSEEGEALLEWRLKKLISQLSKDKCGDPVTRCLQSDRSRLRSGNRVSLPVRGGLGNLAGGVGSSRRPRQAGATACSSCGQAGSNDGDASQNDGEGSTTVGDDHSVADCLL